jgi:hypothetical protein
VDLGRRALFRYINAWFNVLDWGKVGEYYATAASGKPLEF